MAVPPIRDVSTNSRGVYLDDTNVTDLAAAIGAGGGLTDEELRDSPVDVLGPQTDAQYLAANRCTITKSSVASADSSTSLLAANANRKSLTIVNSDENTLYIDASGGTADNACIPVLTGGAWAPSGAMPTNAITGIWGADGVGAATMFEGE